MSSISLKVEGFGGSTIREVCQDACKLAARLRITVEFDFNGVHCMALANGHPKVLEENWQLEMASKKTYKIATTNQRLPIEAGDSDNG